MVQLDYYCGACDRNFVNYDAARQHRDAKGHWECDVCDDMFWTYDAAAQHEEDVDHVADRYCFDCERGFYTERGYEQVSFLLENTTVQEILT